MVKPGYTCRKTLQIDLARQNSRDKTGKGGERKKNKLHPHQGQEITYSIAFLTEITNQP